MKKNIKEIALNYFNIFSQKDIGGLRTIFDDNITLRDWDIDQTGIENVLKANMSIFEQVKTIKVIPQTIITENNLLSAELKIIIDDKDELKVVDIIEFGTNGKIISIKAFKG
tara:strand:- start:141 stop:476 length:336 start_codon:yes stop_codon:yes gene_type:complete